MKLKIIPIFILCLTLCSCSKKPAEIKKDFSATIDCDYNGTKLKAEINAEKHNDLVIKMLEPRGVEGYAYTYKGGRLNINYNELNIDSADDYLPSSSFAEAIYNVLKSVNSEKAVLNGSYNSLAEYKGKCDSGNYILKTDINTGYISELEIKEIKLTASFS